MSYRAFSISLALAVLPLAGQALAAGMDCARAATPAEHAICAEPALVRQDQALSQAYSQVLEAAPLETSRLRREQRAWLKERDACASGRTCLETAYAQRIAALQAQWRALARYVPDNADRLAAEDLRAAIQERMQTDAEFPLEHALQALQMSPAGTTDFANVESGENFAPAEFPQARPEGVSEDEWRALQAANPDPGSENGNTRYTLVDLDGDGKRDLIVDAYTGGTGLFSEISTWRRAGSRFELAGAPLYFTNDRGGNQDGTWIALRGRIYAAYRVGYYGVDHVHLLNPLKSAGDVPRVTVAYRYDLRVPKTQDPPGTGKPITLDDGLHAALTQALRGVDAGRARQAQADPPPVCPVPEGLREEDRAPYYGAGPGHYSFEVVADFPLYLDKVCHVARLIDWFGRYDEKEGLYAEYSYARPDAPDGDIQAYSAAAKRRATSVTTSMGPVENVGGY